MNSRSKIVGITRQEPTATEGNITSAALFVSSDDAGSYVSTSETVEPEHYVTSDSAIDPFIFDEEDSPLSTRWTTMILPALAVITLAAWTIFFAWTNFDFVASGITSKEIVALISAWSIPALLIGVIWMLVMRNSRAEAMRFGDAGMQLRTESEALERRMRAVNEEISLARAFLAQNAQELESVGRQSANQLLAAAEQLGVALADSDAKAKTLEAVSNAATANLEQLRKHLPVVTSAAKDVTNQIGSAGNSAQEQVKSLIAALELVTQSGNLAQESIAGMEESAASVSVRLSTAIDTSSAHLVSTTNDVALRAQDLSALLISSSDDAANRFTQTSKNVLDLVEKSGSHMSQKIDLLKLALSELAVTSAKEDAHIDMLISRIASHIDLTEARIETVDKTVTERTATMAFALEALSSTSDSLEAKLASNQAGSNELLAHFGKLTTSMDDVAQLLNDRINPSINHLVAAVGNVEAINMYSDDLLAKIMTISNVISAQKADVDGLMAVSDKQLLQRKDQVDTLSAALATTRSLLTEMADEADNGIISALLRVKDTAQDAAISSRQILDDELSMVAERVSEKSRQILAEAVDQQVATVNDMIRGSIERNVAVSEASTQKIATQLAQIDEMTGNLEIRLATAQNGFEGIDDDSFARRMVLLTESLNSTAIDVAKILSNEVTDTAWSSYLRGDRGVFTRRAVRLLDTGEARAIATHYGEDPEFREHVNRYIHDFEAMMRVLLSTRDGNAIGVTLLSSDVGKLYVALAQAIERLRN